MIQSILKNVIVAGLCLLIIISSASAQSREEPLFDELTKTFKKDYLSIGILLQTVADFQIERSRPGPNGFTISNMRINLYGELDKGFGYLLKTNLSSSPAILDAKMYYQMSPAFVVDAGRFKAPFSAELLIGAGSIDFVNRSQVVSALAPGRQIGVAARGVIAQNVISYGAGIFNGNSFGSNSNDNNDFMYAGRVTISPQVFTDPEPPDRFEVGLNGAYSRDQNVSLGQNLLPIFRGNRLLLGGDFRYEQRGILLSGEFIYAHLEYPNGATVEPYGFHATSGYRVTHNSQILLRWDNLFGDGLGRDSHQIILGYNLWPSKATELQVNYLIASRDSGIKHHELLVNAQFSF